MNDTAAWRAHLDPVIDGALAAQRLVGAVTLIAHCGETVYARTAGWANRETHQAVKLDTLFRFSSLTKPIVSTAALSLIAAGKLAFDDAIDRWLPEFKPKLGNGSPATITIRQLLTHTAGLNYSFGEPPNGPYHRAGVSDGLDQPGLSLQENLRRIASAPLVSAPGSEWRYSVSLDVLGAALEKVTGQSLGALTHALVTDPLVMQDTAFDVVDRERLAVAYADGRPPQLMRDPHLVPFPPGAGITFAPSRVFNTQSFASGGAGMVGSAPDFLKFLECIRRGGNPILPQKTAASMMQNHIGGFTTFQPGHGFGYGGAVIVDPALTGTPQSAGTWYWGGVYGHSWFVDPRAEISVVLLTNTALEGMIGQTTIELRDAVYRALRA